MAIKYDSTSKCSSDITTLQERTVLKRKMDLIVPIQVISVLVSIICVVIAYFYYSWTYWSRKNVKYIKPTFPYGSFGEMLTGKKSFGNVLKDFYIEHTKRGEKYIGIYEFLQPALVVLDPELVKDVLIKDFDKFHWRFKYEYSKYDPLNAHLVNINGQMWKDARSKLTPTFTSGKMKMMFRTVLECSEELRSVVLNHVENSEAFDVREIMSRFTTDVIGRCAFGIDCNSLKNPDAEFRIYGKRIFCPTLWEVIKTIMMKNHPQLYKKLKISTFSDDLNEFYKRIVKETVEYRQKNGVIKNDFMQLLIKMMNNESIDDENTDSKRETKISMDDAVAHALFFFAAGFETAATTLGFLIYDLAKNPDVQDKVRKEINDVLHKYEGKVTYDAIVELTYMGKVIDETLRLHPSVPSLRRTSTEKYKFANTDLEIEKGTTILMSLYGLQTDPQYYPNPYKYDPERFDSENKDQINPGTYFPFGGGPRTCIGVRFALMEMKIALVELLKDFKFSMNDKTREPLLMDPRSQFSSPIGGIWVNASKI